MKKLLTLFVLICPLLALAQQTRQITGQVLDRADGTPLVGATVFIAPEETQAKNYNPQGTIVYEQGRFAFKLPVSVKKVVVSYLGYEAQTIDISGKSNFTIYLSATESKMDAVVVTGYQRIEKRKRLCSIGMNGHGSLLFARAANAAGGGILGLCACAQAVPALLGLWGLRRCG